MDVVTMRYHLELLREEAEYLDSPADVVVNSILDLCDSELGWYGTSDYSGSVDIRDVLRAVSSSLGVPV